MSDWVDALLSNNITLLLTTTLPGIVSWFIIKRHFQKRELKQADANIDTTTSDVVSKNLDLYQRMLDDIDERYQFSLQEHKKEIQELKQELEKVIKGIADCEKMRQELEIVLTKLKNSEKRNNNN